MILFLIDLDLELSFIHIGQGQLFYFQVFRCLMYGSKDASVLDKLKKRSGAITILKGHRIP